MSPIDIPVFDDALVPRDEAPQGTHELVCRVCGEPLEYGGRGRKPTLCDKHKGTPGGKSRADAIGKNEQLAAQAATALMQVNSLAEMGLRFGKLPMTAEAMAMAKESFKEQVFEALKTDPELCKTILKGGIQSGRIALIIAYAMLASVVAPVATMEIKERRRVAMERAESEDRSSVAGTTSAP